MFLFKKIDDDRSFWKFNPSEGRWRKAGGGWHDSNTCLDKVKFFHASDWGKSLNNRTDGSCLTSDAVEVSREEALREIGLSPESPGTTPQSAPGPAAG